MKKIKKSTIVIIVLSVCLIVWKISLINGIIKLKNSDALLIEVWKIPHQFLSNTKRDAEEILLRNYIKEIYSEEKEEFWKIYSIRMRQTRYLSRVLSTVDTREYISDFRKNYLLAHHEYIEIDKEYDIFLYKFRGDGTLSMPIDTSVAKLKAKVYKNELGEPEFITGSITIDGVEVLIVSYNIDKNMEFYYTTKSIVVNHSGRFGTGASDELARVLISEDFERISGFFFTYRYKYNFPVQFDSKEFT